MVPWGPPWEPIARSLPLIYGLVRGDAPAPGAAPSAEWLQVEHRVFCSENRCFASEIGGFVQLKLVGGDWNMTLIFPYIGNNHPN